MRAIYTSRNLAYDVITPNILITVPSKISDTHIQQIIDYGSEVCYNGKPNCRLESSKTGCRRCPSDIYFGYL